MVPLRTILLEVGPALLAPRRVSWDVLRWPCHLGGPVPAREVSCAVCETLCSQNIPEVLALGDQQPFSILTQTLLPALGQGGPAGPCGGRTPASSACGSPRNPQGPPGPAGVSCGGSAQPDLHGAVSHEPNFPDLTNEEMPRRGAETLLNAVSRDSEGHPERLVCTQEGLQGGATGWTRGLAVPGRAPQQLPRTFVHMGSFAEKTRAPAPVSLQRSLPGVSDLRRPGRQGPGCGQRPHAGAPRALQTARVTPTCPNDFLCHCPIINSDEIAEVSKTHRVPPGSHSSDGHSPSCPRDRGPNLCLTRRTEP